MRGWIAGLAIVVSTLAWGADGLEPWASSSDPADAPRQHTQEITAADQEYLVLQGGTMDGENCRPPVGYGAWHQTWESNRAVRLENVGETDVVNPWLSNGRNDFRTLEEIVAGAVEPGMSDEEKALALWRWQMNHRFHAYTADDEVNGPVKVFNVYGYTLCGNDAICLAGLWKTAGLQVRPARPIGHCVTEVFYARGWHMLDGDEHCIYLLRDNATIACEQEVVWDHDLIKRTHTYGILSGDSRTTDEFSASLFSYEGEGGGDRDCRRGHSMNMTLRPGEALTWRWGHLVPYKFHGFEDIKDWGQDAIDKVCNGLWEYRPDFSGELWQKGAETVEGVEWTPGGLRAQEGKPGVIVWRMSSPYVMVGGRLEVEGTDARMSLSWDGRKWEQAGESLDAQFPPAAPARYTYLLRCELEGQAALKRLAVINDIQMAPLSLPGMRVGENRLRYTDQTPGDHRVRITHEWVERSASRPPEAPEAALNPPDAGDVEGTAFAFRWQPARDPDGDPIADYHFELSGRADMKWPLSPNFERLISLTPDRGKTQYTLPYPGLLTPDRRYYWRVRARDDKGVWGPWSAVWQFTARGPDCPANVTVALDRDRGVGILRWERGPAGRGPALFRVYGSDEKGFTVSDAPYTPNVGNQKEKPATPFPASFVAETAACELEVLGAEVSLPNANRAFYRVVAVDERGNLSWSSEYAAAPRPFIYSKPPLTARVGQEWRYEVRCVRSLGDLRCKVIGKESYNASFWDVEGPKYILTAGPEWLRMDETSGIAQGNPPEAGTVEIAVAVELGRQGRAEQRFTVTVGG